MAILSTTLLLKDKFTSTIRQAAKSTDLMMGSMKRAKVEANRMSNDFQQAMRKAIPRNINMFDAIGSTGKKMTVMGVAGAATMGGMVKVAAGFEEQMSKVRAITGAAPEDFKRLQIAAEEYAAKTRWSAKESAQAMEYMGLSGWKTNDIIAGMPGVLNMASAGAMDLAQASDILTDTMSAFGLAADTSAHAADVFAYAQANANTNISQLGEAMKYLAPVANQLGWSLEESSAAMMAVADSGIKGSMAGAAFATSLGRLAKPTGEMKEVLDKLGIELFDVNGTMKSMPQVIGQIEKGMAGMTSQQKSATLTTLFGAEAYKHWAILVDRGSESLDNMTAALVNSDGTAQKMSDIMEDNLAGSIRSFKSAAEGASIAIGKELNPYIRQGVDFVKALTNHFNNMSPEMKRTVAMTMAIASAVGVLGGGLLILVGVLPKLAAGFVVFRSVMTTLISVGLNPVTLAIAGLVTVGYLLYNNWDKISDYAKNLMGHVINLKDRAIDVLSKSIEKAKDKFIQWSPVIKTTATILGVIFGPALIKTGVQATIAGGKIAGSFVASIVKSGIQSTIAGAKITAGFVASMIKSGTQATIASVKITASFVASMIKTSAQAVATSAVITGKLIWALISYAASGWKTVGAITAQTTAWITQRAVMSTGAIVMGTMTAAQWALNVAMNANPIGLIITGIGLLIGAGVLLVKNWNTVKNATVNAFSAMWNGTKKFINMIISGLNKMIDGLNTVSFSIPDWVPGGLGGKSFGFNISKIPMLPVDGSHAAGLSRVPHDGYVAELHKNETVLNRVDADNYRKGKDGNKIDINVNIDKVNASNESEVDRLINKLGRGLRQQLINTGEVAII